MVLTLIADLWQQVVRYLAPIIAPWYGNGSHTGLPRTCANCSNCTAQNSFPLHRLENRLLDGSWQQSRSRFHVTGVTPHARMLHTVPVPAPVYRRATSQLPAMGPSTCVNVQVKHEPQDLAAPAEDSPPEVDKEAMKLMEEYMRRFPMSEMTFEELDFLTDELYAACEAQNYTFLRILRYHDGDWRKAMATFLQMQTYRKEHKTDALRARLQALPWSLKDCPHLTKAWPVKVAKTARGEPVNMYYFGRMDQAFVEQNKESIATEWQALMEMSNLQLDSIGPEANHVTLFDMGGFSGKMSDIQKILEIVKLAKIGTRINPHSCRKYVFINVFEAIEVFGMAQMKFTSVPTTLEILPRPYSLERLLELTSFAALRQHAQMLPPPKKEGWQVASGDMTELALDVNGAVQWTLVADKEVELSVFFVADRVTEELRVTTARKSGRFESSQPGVLWLRAQNHLWTSARVQMFVKRI